MDSITYTAVLQTAEKLMRPLVRLLLRHGVGEAQLAEVMRRVMVQEGELLLVEGGEKPTASALSGLTGLSRKEVARLRDPEISSLEGVSARRHRAVQVLGAWSNDPEFTEGGKARPLPLKGDSGSFASLVRRFGSDVTPSALLKLLERTGNIRVDEDAAILISEAFIPVRTPAEVMEILGTDGTELLETILHNMSAPEEERLFQRKVSTTRLAPDALAAFKAYSSDESMALLKKYDAWLSNHELNEPNDNTTYVAVGIYFYTNQNGTDAVPVGDE